MVCSLGIDDKSLDRAIFDLVDIVLPILVGWLGLNRV